MQLIEGKKIAATIREELAVEVQQVKQNGEKIPHLAIILVGNDGGSETYVNHKIKACDEIGYTSTLIRFDEQLKEQELLDKIMDINNDNSIDGLIVQLPLPKQIDEQKVIEAIDPNKDVDGFHPVNVGKMVIGLPCFVSATPAGIMELLRRYDIDISGMNCAVIGRSNIVGRPMANLLSQKGKPGNATVTLCHSRTKDIKAITKDADLIVAALGKPEFLTADMVKDGAVVIDVGTTRVKSDKTKSGWKLVGDVKFDEVSPKCSFITPVPGGVGPMTIVSLLRNTMRASKNKIQAI